MEETGFHILHHGRLENLYLLSISLKALDWIPDSLSGEEIGFQVLPSGGDCWTLCFPQGMRLDSGFSTGETGLQVLPQDTRLDTLFIVMTGDRIPDSTLSWITSSAAVKDS